MAMKLVGTSIMPLFLILAAVMPVPISAADPDGSVSVAVVSGRSAVFDDVIEVIKDELGDGFRLWICFNDRLMTADTLARLLDINHTDIAVLMDNRSIALFEAYQRQLPDSAVVIPSVSCLGVSIQQEIRKLRNAAGVSYEVPLVTAAAGLRSIMNKPLKRLGVIHRGIMTEFVNQNIPFCAQEDIEIIAYAIPAESGKRAGSVRKGLKHLLAKGRVDALWVPNDIALLEPETIRSVWVPLVNRYRIPVIVGIEKLVDPRLEFGTFAVLPDQRGIGIQAAALILRAQEDGWAFNGMPAEFPVSVVKTVNLRQAGKSGINGAALESIDKVLE